VNAQPWWAVFVSEQTGRPTVLGHGEVHSTIMIEISRGGTSLFSEDRDTALGREPWEKTALSIPQEQ
jgi:hypothetical protein